MLRFLIATVAVVLMSAPAAHAQAGSAATSVEPFKLGTFRIPGASDAVGHVRLVAGDAAAGRRDHRDDRQDWHPPGTGSYLPPVASYRKPQQ